MNTNQLVRKFVERYHLRFIKGTPDDPSVLMPYFLMDVAYQYYCKSILPVKWEHKMREAQRKWSDSYLAFSRIYTSVYNLDEKIYLGDMIDEMQATMSNDLELLRLSAMDVFSGGLDTDGQGVIAAVFMTNKLSAISQNMWG